MTMTKTVSKVAPAFVAALIVGGLFVLVAKQLAVGRNRIPEIEGDWEASRRLSMDYADNSHITEEELNGSVWLFAIQMKKKMSFARGGKMMFSDAVRPESTFFKYNLLERDGDLVTLEIQIVVSKELLEFAEPGAFDPFPQQFKVIDQDAIARRMRMVDSDEHWWLVYRRALTDEEKANPALVEINRENYSKNVAAISDSGLLEIYSAHEEASNKAKVFNDNKYPENMLDLIQLNRRMKLGDSAVLMAQTNADDWFKNGAKSLDLPEGTPIEILSTKMDGEKGWCELTAYTNDYPNGISGWAEAWLIILKTHPNIDGKSLDEIRSEQRRLVRKKFTDPVQKKFAYKYGISQYDVYEVWSNRVAEIYRQEWDNK